MKDSVLYLPSQFSHDLIESGFIEGLNRNSSISLLQLNLLDQDGGHELEHALLNAYQEDNSNLTRLAIIGDLITNIGQNLVEQTTATLRMCTNVQEFTWFGCNMTNEQLAPIVSVVREHCGLEKLVLSHNRIGDAGCEALASLIEDPNSNLRILDIGGNPIGNDGASTITNALARNKRLLQLSLGGDNDQIDPSSVGDMFSHLLCNTTSINSTYTSNHTLQAAVHCLRALPQHAQYHIRSLLGMNRGTNNKSHVAMKKILRYHPNIDISPMFEWDSKGEQTLKALPYVVAWFERAQEAVTSDEGVHYGIHAKKLSSIFQFARAMPLLFVPVSQNKVDDKKRKRKE